jgi:Ca2+-binding EF-hand superfamily protein
VVDLDDDYVASRVELTAWFKGNEGTICRPFKTSIEKALDDSQLKSLSLFFSFLDANGDGKIEKADVKVAFSTLDQNGNRWLSRRELSSVSDPIISQMCREFANINKEKFLKLSKKQKSTKKDLFALLDKNNNGKLTSREYR